MSSLRTVSKPCSLSATHAKHRNGRGQTVSNQLPVPELPIDGHAVSLISQSSDYRACPSIQVRPTLESGDADALPNLHVHTGTAAAPCSEPMGPPGNPTTHPRDAMRRLDIMAFA